MCSHFVLLSCTEEAQWPSGCNGYKAHYNIYVSGCNDYNTGIVYALRGVTNATQPMSRPRQYSTRQSLRNRQCPDPANSSYYTRSNLTCSFSYDVLTFGKVPVSLLAGKAYLWLAYLFGLVPRRKIGLQTTFGKSLLIKCNIYSR